MVAGGTVSLVDVTRLPRHVALIMDGNGRWAQRSGLQRKHGHEQGSKAVRRTVRAARRLGIPALTLFAFSEQNWVRPPEEITALMELLRDYLQSERAEMLDNGIRLHPVGRLDKLPDRVREVMDPLQRDSAELDGMTLTLCVAYGGREEIVDAARTLATRAAEGRTDPNEIDVGQLEGCMSSLDVGPVDLLIRTGGEYRISNFVLWAAAYAELFFTPTLWPDYNETDFYEAIAFYQRRNRRFGGLDPDAGDPTRDPQGGVTGSRPHV